MAKLSDDEKNEKAQKKAEGLKILEKLDTATVKSYIDEFDKKQKIAEGALVEVFGKYKGSKNVNEIFIMVQMLNQLYSAGLNSNKPLEENTSEKVDVYTMAERLAENAEHVSEWLEDADRCTAVNNIIGLFPEYDRPYSFVTKYCSWLNSEKYPIADSYSKGVLYHYFGRETAQSEFNDYNEFCRIFDAFKALEIMNDVSVKNVDKFLWSFGKKYGIKIE